MISKKRDPRLGPNLRDGSSKNNIFFYNHQGEAMITIPSDEQPAPLKTHLDVSGVEIFLIDDGNKSSKEKYIFTDGR
jgi:hypothetical protein